MDEELDLSIRPNTLAMDSAADKFSDFLLQNTTVCTQYSPLHSNSTEISYSQLIQNVVKRRQQVRKSTDAPS